MDIEDAVEGMGFEGEMFVVASIVCDTRDGELAIVVAQTGEEVDVRWFSKPLEIHRGRAIDFARVDGRQLACVGFVAESLENDEAHMAKAIAQVGKLFTVLPPVFIDLIRGT